MPAALIPMIASNQVCLRLLVDEPTPYPPVDYSVQIGSSSPAPIGGWRHVGDGLNRIWFTNHPVAGGGGKAVLRDAADNEVAHAELPPTPSVDRLTMIVGSCLARRQARQVVDEMYADVTARLDHAADVNVWLGDQVYVDEPAFEVARLEDPWAWVLERYRWAWGLEPGAATTGLRTVMARTANVYIPDDHEFWNGYPAPSLTLPIHMMKRMARQIIRFARPNRPLVHPSAQGPLGHAAGAAYCAFQSSRDFASFDESVNPEGIQIVERQHSLLALVDTRWRRTIRKTGSGFLLKAEATFMAPADLDRLVALLTSEPRLVCLGLSRPIVGFLPHRGHIRPRIEYAAEDYADQYTRLWAALSVRSDNGWPTIVLGGDVHTVSVKTALDRRLLEVTSSPLAQLPQVDEHSLYSRMQRRGRALKIAAHRLLNGRRSQPITSDVYPVVKDGVWDGTVGRGSVDFEEPRKPAAALSGLSIHSSGTGHHEVDIHTVYDPDQGAPDPRRQTPDRRYTWDGAGWVFVG